MKVEVAYARMRDAMDGHPYLERERALPGALLALDRFAGRVRIDDKGNAIFPHSDRRVSAAMRSRITASPALLRADRKDFGFRMNALTIMSGHFANPQLML